MAGSSVLQVFRAEGLCAQPPLHHRKRGLNELIKSLELFGLAEPIVNQPRRHGRRGACARAGAENGSKVRTRRLRVYAWPGSTPPRHRLFSRTIRPVLSGRIKRGPHRRIYFLPSIFVSSPNSSVLRRRLPVWPFPSGVTDQSHQPSHESGRRVGTCRNNRCAIPRCLSVSNLDSATCGFHNLKCNLVVKKGSNVSSPFK